MTKLLTLATLSSRFTSALRSFSPLSGIMLEGTRLELTLLPLKPSETIFIFLFTSSLAGIMEVLTILISTLVNKPILTILPRLTGGVCRTGGTSNFLMMVVPVPNALATRARLLTGFLRFGFPRVIHFGSLIRTILFKMPGTLASVAMLDTTTYMAKTRNLFLLIRPRGTSALAAGYLQSGYQSTRHEFGSRPMWPPVSFQRSTPH